MLKFQNNHTTDLAAFEDFILTVYVMIDDLDHPFAPDEVVHRRHASDARLSDSEIISISICGELSGVDSENAWFSFVKKNYCHLFPILVAEAVLTEQCVHFCRQQTYYGRKWYLLLSLLKSPQSPPMTGKDYGIWLKISQAL